MEDLIDVVNDLENKDEELSKLKAFQEIQATELTQVRKDFHELERDSKEALEKSEYKSNKDLHAANTKVFKFWNFVSEFLFSREILLSYPFEVTWFDEEPTNFEFLTFMMTQNWLSQSYGYNWNGPRSHLGPWLFGLPKI